MPDGVVGGVRSTWDRVGRRRNTPGLVKLLYRLTALGGGALDAEEGDVHSEHRLDGIGIFDFAGARTAIDAGYELTRGILRDRDPIVRRS